MDGSATEFLTAISVAAVLEQRQPRRRYWVQSSRTHSKRTRRWHHESALSRVDARPKGTDRLKT